MNTARRYMIILYGPTGVGKSDLAERLAQHMPAQIINADMGQLYAPLSIGTAKPDYKHSPIVHSMFDLISSVTDTPRNFTVIQYRQKFLDCLSQAHAASRMPIVVGGSGFYVQSILFPPHDNDVTIEHEKDLAIDNTPTLWDQLYAIDPARASAIHKHDRYRIVRALQLWHATGKMPSSFALDYEPPCQYLFIWMTRDRQDLYARIDARVHAMMDAGWVDEVRALQATEWEPFLRSKKIIGYEQILDYLDGRYASLDEIIPIIQQRTRNYAKRQGTFWNMLHKKLIAARKSKPEFDDSHSKIQVINLTLLNLDLYIKQLSQRLEDILAQ